MRKWKSKQGFTLAELLIVVAIIAILVAIGIPAFSTAMERSRETVDLANIRAAYAEFMAGTLGSDANTGYYQVDIKQSDTTKWTIDTDGFIANIDGNTMPISGSGAGADANFKKGLVWVTFSIKDQNKTKPVLSFTALAATRGNDGKITSITAPFTVSDSLELVDGSTYTTATDGTTTTTETAGAWFLVNNQGT